MTKSTKSPIVLLAKFAILCAALLGTSSVFAQQPEELAIARKLVEQAQLHKMAALGLRLSIRRSVVNGEATQELLECVSAVDPDIFLPPIATIYAENLASGDLKDALSFFETAAGQKYVSYTFRGTEEYAGFPPTTPPTTVTIGEKRLIEKFISSPVGKQMSGTSIPLAISTQREISKIVEPILGKCIQPRGPLQTQLIPDSSSYVASLVAKIRREILYSGNHDSFPGNPRARLRIEQLPTGEIVSVKNIESSGVPDFDVAVTKAVYRSSPLPKQIDGNVERVLIIDFFMKEASHAK